MNAEVALADWSNLPKDIYVVSAKSHGGIAFDVTCCSVPMITAPEVRYTRADLIAAPDMLAALKRAEEALSNEADNRGDNDADYSSPVTPALDAVRTAIAKASA